jgi:hypothetical protein
MRANRIDHDLKEFASSQWVKTRQRFVEKKDFRASTQRECQADLCLLAARQACGDRDAWYTELSQALLCEVDIEGWPEKSCHDKVIVDGQSVVQRW